MLPRLTYILNTQFWSHKTKKKSLFLYFNTSMILSKCDFFCKNNQGANQMRKKDEKSMRKKKMQPSHSDLWFL